MSSGQIARNRGSAARRGTAAVAVIALASAALAGSGRAQALAGSIRVATAAAGTFYGQAMTAGDIYTIAGTGTAGFAGDGGPATRAELEQPDGMAVTSTGNVMIADENLANEDYSRVRLVQG